MFLKLKRKVRSLLSLNDVSDELLLNLYLESGDKELIAELFERYTHLVYGICLNYLHDSDRSKDAVMEIFEGLFHKLAVHQVLNFRNWLYSVARNHCLMALRKSGSHIRTMDHLQVELHETEVPEFLTDEERPLFSKELIGSAVEQLSHEQGTCIRLMYIDDKSYRDISAITGYSVNEVKSHIQNGKRNLKNFLLKRDGNPKT